MLSGVSKGNIGEKKGYYCLQATIQNYESLWGNLLRSEIHSVYSCFVARYILWHCKKKPIFPIKQWFFFSLFPKYLELSLNVEESTLHGGYYIFLQMFC